ncbi:PRC-barrel domain-containing protein, partial [Geodermatophilus amargosae]|uniref:PRC-barrel domain-containing protein n=1 Tax=Geodermatophilus amargosae TaxID=1296565 RepID=UPI0034DEDBE7
MITDQQISDVIGSTAVGPDGKHGSVGEVFLDDETGRPEWATVRTGLFGTKEAFVPLADATVSGGELRLPYDKAKVKGAPHVDVSAGHLSPQEEEELYRYYGVGTSGTTTGQATTGQATTGQAVTTGTTGRDRDHDGVRDDLAGRAGVVGHDTSGPTTDNAMTRSEEHLNVGVQRV